MPGQRHHKSKLKDKDPRRRIKSSPAYRTTDNFYYYPQHPQNQQARFATLTASLTQSHTFQQLAPIFVLFFLPAFFIFVASRVRRMSAVYRLGSWLWSSSASSEKKHRKTKLIRSRAEQVARLEGSKGDGSDTDGADDGWYPGLVNISGTYCFMNSTIQAIPHNSYRAIRPTDLIQVLSTQAEGRPNSLFYSREHQDAQELFQLVSECIKNELSAVDKEGLRDQGLKGLGLTNGGEEWRKEIGKSVFDGLTANRRSCTVCQYTEAVMHFSLDNWQVAVPRARTLILQSVENPSTHKKKKIREMRGIVERVGKSIKEGRIEDDLDGVKMDKVFRLCTKQTMIARPPSVLVLHINRSVHSGYYASKNSVRLIFPEILDLTPTVPNHSISTPPPLRPRSTTPTPGRYAQERERTIYRLASVVCHFGQHSFGHYICYRRKPRGNREGEERWVPPRLVEVQEEEDSDKASASISQLGVKQSLAGGRYVFADPPARPGKGWLRISDDSVREVGLDAVLAEGSGAFMLYYERAVIEPSNGIYKGSRAVSTSEETLKPIEKTIGEGVKGVCEVGVGVRGRSDERKELEVKKVKVEEGEGKGLAIPFVDFDRKVGTARIVRNVAAGRRSASAATSREGSVISVSPPESSLSVGALPRTSPLSKGINAEDKRNVTKSGNGNLPNGIYPNGVPKFPLGTSGSLESSISSSMAVDSEDVMMASAPALLPSPSPASPSPSPAKKKKKKKRIQSPQPQAASPVVGLKA
ncbi:hypothetical protein BDQ17DRAFT_1359895 [Cyathus striatus]|nr:hypothetical protein BDQ17DRAFT_1359895 [Cyathus striatus]